jgi:hypothetical protein
MSFQKAVCLCNSLLTFMSIHRVGNRFEVSLSMTLPIHLRYQEPSRTSTHSKIVLPPPLIYFRCCNSSPWILHTAASRDETKSGEHSEDAPLVLELWVPVGEKQQQGLVTVVTLLATTLGSSVVLYFLWRHREGKGLKRE